MPRKPTGRPRGRPKTKTYTRKERDRQEEALIKKTGASPYVLIRNGVQYTIDANGNLKPLK